MSLFGDWGTTRLRLFRVEDGVAIDRLDGPGIGQLTGSARVAFADAIAPWRDMARRSGVHLCGMAGARGGLAEAEYLHCPIDHAGWSGRALQIDLDGVRVRIAAGVRGTNFARRVDVMRGEETQIFGAIALRPDLARGRHMVVLPGTHSKWAELLDGTILRFHTFATGELFALLRDHSTLTRAGTDAAGFDDGFVDGTDRCGIGLASGLFEARAAQLVEHRSHGWALGFLSGLLIGTEIAEAIRMRGPIDNVVLVGAPAQCDLYARAFTAGGRRDASSMDGDLCVIAGLGLFSRGKP